MKANTWRRMLSLVLAVALCMGALGVGSGGEYAGASKAKIDGIKGDINQKEAEIKEVQAKLDAIRGDKNQAIQQKMYLDEQIALSDQRIAQIDAVLEEYDLLIAEKEQEVADLRAKEEAQYELFCKRVRAMEEQGTVSYLSILFDAASFSELLDNMMLIGEIMDYDNRVIDDLQATRQKVEEAEAELEEGKAEQQALREEETAAREELAAREEEAAELVRQITLKENEYAAVKQQKEAEEAELQREMEKARKEYEAEQERIRQEQIRQQQLLQQQQAAAASDPSIKSESGFIWPVTGYLTLTSKYGWRTSPITGRSEFHLGTDIPAPRGTAILAAKSGKVTTSKSHYSYGNYVVITHSNGEQTLYAHMSQRAVSVGQTVTQGQVIGYVGSTGDSTGNHLHYEVWKNGSRTNAESYYSLPFVRRY